MTTITHKLEFAGRVYEAELPEVVAHGLLSDEYIAVPHYDEVLLTWVRSIDIYDKNERIIFHWDNPNSPEPELLSSPAIHLVELTALAPGQSGAIISATVMVNPASICFYQPANVPNRECVGVTFSGNVQLIVDMSYDNFTKFLQGIS